jgi:signal transduction histidine kinase
MPFLVPLGVEGQPAPFGMVLGVETRKIENAWLSALPGVGIAAGIVTPFAVLLAVVLARQIARPVHQLTSASEAMARGDFEQRVEVERQDEVGRLAKAFSVMAERVGERDAQMRALIANVSHDLKTPMTSIIGYAQALRDGVTDDTKRAAETIQRQATVAHELLADLLFLSEIDSGQSVRVEGEATAREIVEAAAFRIQPAMEAKAVRLALEVDETAIIAGVDAQRVVRALTNVLDNAVRFSPEGEVVRVSAIQEGGSVRLEVENRGPRISEEDLPHVLERFYRGKSGGYGGHGLGLAIANEAIELNGGSILIANVETGVRVIISFAAG